MLVIALPSTQEEELNEEALQKAFKWSWISGQENIPQTQWAAQWQVAYRDLTHSLRCALPSYRISLTVSAGLSELKVWKEHFSDLFAFFESTRRSRYIKSSLYGGNAFHWHWHLKLDFMAGTPRRDYPSHKSWESLCDIAWCPNYQESEQRFFSTALHPRQETNENLGCLKCLHEDRLISNYYDRRNCELAHVHLKLRANQ